jgi:hypothetical protein
MAFSKTTEVLTMDEDWLPLSSLTSSTKLWGGRQITSILNIETHTSCLIHLKGKFKLGLICSSSQCLIEYKSSKLLLAKDCLQKPLDFIQDGEERVPFFKSLNSLDISSCISLTTDGFFYIRVNKLTGLTIPPG